jgi:hypothetical protein
MMSNKLVAKTIIMEFSHSNVMNKFTRRLVLLIATFGALTSATAATLATQNYTASCAAQIDLEATITFETASEGNQLQVRWYYDSDMTQLAGIGELLSQGSYFKVFRYGVNAFETKTYYLAIFNKVTASLEESSEPVTSTVSVNNRPATPGDQNFSACILSEVRLQPQHTADNLMWFDSDENFLGINLTWKASGLSTLANRTFKIAAWKQNGCTSIDKATITIAVNTDCEDALNWIETKSYGYDGSAVQPVIANTIGYFGSDGRGVQSQSKLFSGPAVMITPEPLKDLQGREVLSFLSAPVQSEVLKYDHFFTRTTPYENYTAKHFEGAKRYNPDPMGNTSPGTLAWYFSNNNNIETNVPTTGFPYARTEYYEDGSGEPKRAGGVGETLKLGSGHEVLGGTFPVFSELTDYYSRRAEIFPGSMPLIPGVNAGGQSVSRDQNGKYAIAINDRNGKNVISARKGSNAAHTLVITNNVTSTVDDVESVNYRPSTYFYLLDDQIVSLTAATGSLYTIEDIVANQVYNPVADGDPEWEAGFYRIILTSGTVSLQYTNYLEDVSYSFYDDAGRLKTSVSPNGVKQLKQGIALGSVDQTSNTYNHRGWLLSMTEPDAGTTRYQYRRDGKIRFSQNAVQYQNDHATSRESGTGKFSYTHYDYLGRPVESGEYTGTALTFASVSSQLELEFDPAADFGADKKDWIRSHYEFAANEDAFIPDLPAGLPGDLIQENLRGAVSSSENANIQTWYSYDEFGRVTWMAQKPTRLNRTFVTRYTYDYLGNITVVHNASYASSAVALDAFYHHYEYDKDNRLWKAYTSTDGSNKKLRATYDYYLHGPLKRIELGDKLQGIDFVYNIHGWLTQINHPDKAQDPGGDGSPGDNAGVRPDVFGMVLDYYESDLNNLYTASTFSPNRMKDLHGLPASNTPAYAANHQPLIRFNDFYSYDPSEVSIDSKEHSAENPKYRTMLSELHNNR